MPIFCICSFNLYTGEAEIRSSRRLEAASKVAVVDLANIYCAGCKNQPLGWLIVRLSSPSSQFSLYITHHRSKTMNLDRSSSTPPRHPCRAVHPATVSLRKPESYIRIWDNCYSTDFVTVQIEPPAMERKRIHKSQEHGIQYALKD